MDKNNNAIADKAICGGKVWLLIKTYLYLKIYILNGFIIYIFHIVSLCL